MSDVVYWLSSAGFAALAYVWAKRLGRRAVAWAVACFFFNWLGFGVLVVTVLINAAQTKAERASRTGLVAMPESSDPMIRLEFHDDEDGDEDEYEDVDPAEFPFEVVGESHHRAALISLLKKFGDAKAGTTEFQRVTAPAALVREPSNKFDKNAIAVHVDGQLVGYVPRDAAAELAGALGSNGRHECRALLQGRLDGLIGVTLDADIDALLP